MLKSLMVLAALSLLQPQQDAYSDLAVMAMVDVLSANPTLELLLDLEPFEGVARETHATRVGRVAAAVGFRALSLRDDLGCDLRADPGVDCQLQDERQIVVRLGQLEVEGDRATLGISTFFPDGRGRLGVANSLAVFQRDAEGKWTLTEWIAGATT